MAPPTSVGHGLQACAGIAAPQGHETREKQPPLPITSRQSQGSGPPTGLRGIGRAWLPPLLQGEGSGSLLPHQGDLGPVEGDDRADVTLGGGQGAATADQPEGGEQGRRESTEKGRIHGRWDTGTENP